MSGIERLRAIAGAWDEWGLGGALAEMADEIERECAEVADSPYDAILPEDREAIAWVRDHGGIDELTRMFQDADNRRVELCAALGIDLDKGWSEAMAAMRLRLMPEGYEWPRYESGEPLRYEDRYVYDGREREVWHVDFDSYGEPTILNKDGTRSHPDKGERVERPAPKVLDADGVEIRVGDTVYHVKDGSEMTVYGIEGEWLIVSVGGRIRHDIVTHRAPVLAADGEPLEVGQTVWDTNGDELQVLSIEDDYERHVTCHYEGIDGIKANGWWLPSQLTHERPDSWERLEEDARNIRTAMLDSDKLPFEVIDERALDLVRRAKKLAGVDND